MALTFKKCVTIAELYEIIHPYNIFKKYCINWGDVEYALNRNFISDPLLRPGDKDPSARITVSSTGKLYYIDYGENIARSAVNFVKDRYKLYTLQQAITKILNEVDKDSIDINIPNKINKTINHSKHTSKIIKIKSKLWNKNDLIYWKQYGWTLEFLNAAKIVPISKFWVDGIKYIITEPTYCFNYYIHEDIFRRKIYFPFKQKSRFVSNIDNTIVQGWDMLPKLGGDLLIITKAYKDVGTFKAINQYACATNNETSFFPEEVVNKLKSRWKRIIIWWDNDNEGIKSGNKYAKLFDLEFIHNGINNPKDPSDYYKEKGKQAFLVLFNKLIN